MNSSHSRDARLHSEGYVRRTVQKITAGRPKGQQAPKGVAEESTRIRAALADESAVDGFLRNAEQILETAVVAKDNGAQDCTICVTRLGTIRILAEPAGWSLPALAADLGAAALYRVERSGGAIRVEGCSPAGTCVLRRDLSAPWRPRGHAGRPHATCETRDCRGTSKNDLSPQVRNS
jgi:hypothetical protein